MSGKNEARIEKKMGREMETERILDSEAWLGRSEGKRMT